MDEPDPQQAWDLFVKTFCKIADKYAPYKNMHVRNANEKWITDDYIGVAHDRDYFSDKYRKTGNYEHKIRHRFFRNRANIMARCLKRDYIMGELEANKGKPDALWKTLKQLIPSTKSGGAGLE